jgi:hypothetical protein
MRLAAAILLPLALFAATPSYSETSFSEENLRAYLREYDAAAGGKDKTLRYSFASVQLAQDQPNSVLVYLEGNDWCGSGGCDLLILEPRDSSFRKITTVAISRPPIRVLTHTTKGWKDIAVLVCGGGILRCYEAALPFDGRCYASNPTVRPAREIEANAPGETVIQAGQSQPLY